VQRQRVLLGPADGFEGVLADKFEEVVVDSLEGVVEIGMLLLVVAVGSMIAGLVVQDLVPLDHCSQPCCRLRE
jgi:hypothetical protein